MMSDETDSGKQWKYWAFISYSSRDASWGEWVLKAIERYRIPKAFVGKNSLRGPVPSRLRPLFRDRDELRASPTLAEDLEAALRLSRWLIVLCSPNSARPDSWVNREVATFKTLGRSAELLALIVGGEPNASARRGGESVECFPSALRFEVDATGQPTANRSVEPIAADATREDRRPRAARRRALLKIIAAMIGVAFDDLWQRETRRRRRRLAVAGSTALATFALLAGLLGFGLRASRGQLSVALAGQATEQSSRSPGLALLLGVAAFHTAPTAAAYGSLLTAVNENPHLVTTFHDLSSVSAIAFSPDATRLAVAGCATPDCPASTVLVHDLTSREQARGPIGQGLGRVTLLDFEPVTGRLVAVDSQAATHRVVALDLTVEEPVMEPIYQGRQEIESAVWAGDGRRYAVALNDRLGELKIFEKERGRICGAMTDAEIDQMTFSSDGRLVAVHDRSNQITVVEVPGCASRSFHADEAADLTFDASDGLLVTIMPVGTLTDLEIAPGKTGRDRFHLTGFMLKGYLHAISADASLLASKDGRDVLLFDLAKRRSIVQRLRSTDDPPGLMESEELKREMEQLQIAQLRGSDAEPVILRFSSDDRLLATADASGTVFLWDVRGKPLVEELPLAEESPEDTSAAPLKREALSADGSIRATVGETAEGCVGDSVSLCKRTTTLKLTRVATGEEIRTLETTRTGLGAVEAAAGYLVEFTADGDVATSSLASEGRTTARFAWHVAPEALVKRACRMANRTLGPGDPDLTRLAPGWRSWLVAPACQR